MFVNGRVYEKGDWVTIDGGSGKVYEGKIGVRDPKVSKNFRVVMKWA